MLGLNDCPPTPGTQSGMVTPILLMEAIALLINPIAPFTGAANIPGIAVKVVVKTPVTLLPIAAHDVEILSQVVLIYEPKATA